MVPFEFYVYSDCHVENAKGDDSAPGIRLFRNPTKAGVTGMRRIGEARKTRS